MLKVVQGSSLDSIAAYEMREADIPEAQRGQVVIEVAACGVGYVDSRASGSARRCHA